MNNVAVVSGGQQRDSATHMHVFILPHPPLPSKRPHNLEQSSLCYSAVPFWLSIVNIAECTCRSQAPYLFPLFFPTGNH